MFISVFFFQSSNQVRMLIKLQMCFFVEKNFVRKNNSWGKQNDIVFHGVLQILQEALAAKSFFELF